VHDLKDYTIAKPPNYIN